jgi:uncharacterized membrane protein YfcA
MEGGFIGTPGWEWELTVGMIIAILAITWVLGIIDSSVGMGLLGVAGVPLLIGFGFHPWIVVPSMIFARVVTGIHASIWHTIFRNVRWGKKKGRALDVRPRETLELVTPLPKEKAGILGWRNWTIDTIAVVIFGVVGVGGVVMGAFPVHVAVGIPAIWGVWINEIMVLPMWLWILLNWVKKRDFTFSYKKLWIFGLIAAFIGGVGGGHGLTIAAQIISGRNVKGSIGVTILVGAFVSLIAVIVWFLLLPEVWWKFVLLCGIGAFMSSPFGALILKRFGERKWELVIGLLIILLGIREIFRQFGVWFPF